MDSPEHVRAQLARIRADGEQQIEKLRADGIAEALAVWQRLRGSDADLIPLRLVCASLALEAMKAEPLPRRKQLAHYETACVAVRNAKAAIRAGIMTPREQGAGLPVDLSHWCAEDETLRTLEEFMPHSRVMVRRSDARSWLESIGAAVPSFLHCKQTQAAPTQEPDENAAPEPPAPATAPSDTKDEALREYDALLAGGTGKNEAARQVEKKYGIPRSTLRDRLKRRDASVKGPWRDLLSQTKEM